MLRLDIEEIHGKANSVKKINKFHKTFFVCNIPYNMDPKEEKKIIESIIKNRRLPYSIELLDADGDKFTVRNNFGSTVNYIKKGEDYILEDGK